MNTNKIKNASFFIVATVWMSASSVQAKPILECLNDALHIANIQVRECDRNIDDYKCYHTAAKIIALQFRPSQIEKCEQDHVLGQPAKR